MTISLEKIAVNVWYAARIRLPLSNDVPEPCFVFKKLLFVCLRVPVSNSLIYIPSVTSGPVLQNVDDDRNINDPPKRDHTANRGVRWTVLDRRCAPTRGAVHQWYSSDTGIRHFLWNFPSFAGAYG